MMSEYWESFVMFIAEDGENRNSPLYRLLVDHFLVQFILKLLSIINFGSSDEVKNEAALLLIHNVNDIAEMDSETLKSFQAHAIALLNSDGLGSPEIRKCASVLTTKVLSISLDQNRKWVEFLKMFSQVFMSGANILDFFLEMFCQQRVVLQHKLVTQLQPYFQIEHLHVLLELLEKGEDHKPFMILPSISHMLRRDRWSLLMEGAITSPIFDSTIDSLRKVASSLRFCLQHSTFDFSPVMIKKIRNIITLLLQSNHDGEKRMAVKLCGALLASCFPESTR